MGRDTVIQVVFIPLVMGGVCPLDWQGCVQHHMAQYPWESQWGNGKIQSSVLPPAELAFWEGGELVLAINMLHGLFPR